jgi:hypothetical protein
MQAGEETGMKTHVALAVLAVALASPLALAQDRPLTREEVKAEVQRARADGSLDAQRGDYTGWWENRGAMAGAQGRSAEGPRAVPGAQGGKTRAEVKEELRRARESGELDRSLERSHGGY